jgi:hypothetical protein
MGVEVKSAAVFGLRFPETVESQLVHQWISTWLERAMAERELIEQKRILRTLLGQETALVEFVEGVTSILQPELVDGDGVPLPIGDPRLPGLQRSLELLLLGTQNLLIQDAELRSMLADEEARLAELLAWVRG